MSSLDVEQGLAGALRQVLGSAKTLFDADMTGLMLVDHAGALRLASAAIEDVAGDPDRLGQGPCCIAFTQRVPVAVRDLSAEPGRRALVQVGLDAASRGALSVPVQVAGGPVGRWMSTSPPQGTGTTTRPRPCRPMPGWSPAC